MEENAKIIIPAANHKVTICRSILEALPEWFGIESARENYIREVKHLEIFACVAGNHPIGFIGLKTHNPLNIEIYVMGVLPAWHRQGIGKKLITRSIEHSKQQAIQFITVKTLSAQSDAVHYANTRLFYQSCGFAPFEEFPDLWGSDNPCLMMIRPI